MWAQQLVSWNGVPGHAPFEVVRRADGRPRCRREVVLRDRTRVSTRLEQIHGGGCRAGRCLQWLGGCAAEAEAEAEAEEEAPRARGWAAAAALSDREGVVFGGLAGSDAAPERLGDAWRVRLEVEYYGTEDYI